MNDPLEMQIDSWMKKFAAIDDRDHILPDPSVIWLKARVLQSAKAVERASRPITAMQLAAYAAVAACWAAMLTWKWQAFSTLLKPGQIILESATASAPAISLPFIATLLALGSITAALAMHTIFVEE